MPFPFSQGFIQLMKHYPHSCVKSWQSFYRSTWACWQTYWLCCGYKAPPGGYPTWPVWCGACAI